MVYLYLMNKKLKFKFEDFFFLKKTIESVNKAVDEFINTFFCNQFGC